MAECAERFRAEYPEVRGQKIGHLGALDPMASGLVVFLVDESTKEYLELQKLTKTYEFKLVFGAKTDSYDILGIVEPDISKIDSLSDVLIKEVLRSFIGKINQSPPLYSNIKIKGKPLYWWFHRGRGSEIEIKPRIREIFSIETGGIYELDIILIKNRLELIRRLTGDFRQEKIIENWERVLDSLKGQNKNFQAVDVRVSCSSGTYIRSLTNDVGQKIGAPAFALDIYRMAIGDYSF